VGEAVLQSVAVGMVEADLTGEHPVGGGAEGREGLEELAAPGQSEAGFSAVCVPASLFDVAGERRCHDLEFADLLHVDLWLAWSALDTHR
jgi:hypothetical protein